MYQNFTLESTASQALNTATHSCYPYAKCIQSYVVDTWKAPSPENTPHQKAMCLSQLLDQGKFSFLQRVTLQGRPQAQE